MWRLVPLVLFACCAHARAASDEEKVLAESLRQEFRAGGRSGFRAGPLDLSKIDDIVPDSDMDLTAAQYQALYSKSTSRKRQAGKSSWAKPWTGGVVPYYLVEGDFDAGEQADLQTSMETIEKWSCVNFREKNDADENYIKFTNGDGRRCSSSVGMNGDGEQAINLAKKGCRLISTYIHEMLHALGFVHEHQLPTRAGKLKLWLVNAKAEKHHNFKPYSEDAMTEYRQEYDLGSIMHYSTKSFTIDTGKTMTTGQGFQDEYVGMKYFNQMSFGDVKSLNMFYKCAASCPKNKACESSGGILLKDCTCLTADDYDAQTCSDKKSVKYCEGQLLSGECYMDRKSSATDCAKTCGFCGVFKTGEAAKPEDKSCGDYYHNRAKCTEWAAAGRCHQDARYPSYHKWMAVNCRKTCGKCSEPAVCANYLLYEYICYWYQESYCTDTVSDWGEKMRSSCKARCGLCNTRPQGNCANRLSDAECKARADRDLCEDDPVQMFQDCPKTCNRCDYNQGNCQNFHSDEQDCLQLAATNHCTSGGNKIFMEKRCAKACNSCDKATVPCEDIDTSGNCKWFTRFGHCTHELRSEFMKRRCAKSCGFC